MSTTNTRRLKVAIKAAAKDGHPRYFAYNENSTTLEKVNLAGTIGRFPNYTVRPDGRVYCDMGQAVFLVEV